MILRSLFRPKEQPAELLYRAIVTAARQPRFYAEWGVPDTVDGRFDMIVIHLFLVLERLRGSPEAADVAQDLTDTFFADMDRSLREMGVGDLSVGKKVRKMAEACYGRLEAYRKAHGDEAATAAAVARNVFPQHQNATGALHIARWMREVSARLAGQDAGRICAGEVTWS